MASLKSAWFRTALHIGSRIAFALAILSILTAAILTRPSKRLDKFDQPFYLTVAYHLVHHGVFGNGFVDRGNSASAAPAPGMFFGPLYPSLVAAMTHADRRFAQAVDCGARTYFTTRAAAGCDAYVRPMLLLHALLLTLGVLAVALAAEILCPGPLIFWTSGVLATGALLADADLFSFLMTESTVFSLYSLAMLALVCGWTTLKRRYFVLAGLTFGLLCLTRFSFLAAAAIVPALTMLNTGFLIRPRQGWGMGSAIGFLLAFLAVLAPWAVRNAVSVGKMGMTEEYGSVTLIERIAYDRMTLREFLLAFPYCLPKIGPGIVEHGFGADAMRRFEYERPHSFYAAGVAHRDALTARFTRLDPVIVDVIGTEMRENWWRYLLVSIPLAWCGMWVGGWLGLAFIPLFAAACVVACRRSKPLLLVYAAPAVVLLALHAMLASFYTRYNLVLIGPFSVAAAWLFVSVLARGQAQWRVFLAARNEVYRVRPRFAGE